MRIDRVFSQGNKDPYHGIEFVERVSRINNADGSVVAEIKHVMVPDFWSQVAVDIMAQKYFRKAGVPPWTRKRYESGVPEWLCPSEPDTQALAQTAESEPMTRETDSRRLHARQRTP